MTFKGWNKLCALNNIQTNVRRIYGYFDWTIGWQLKGLKLWS